MTNAETVAREMRAVVEKLDSLSYAQRLIARWIGMLECDANASGQRGEGT